jgi:putative ABC transport system substrate-binding protein
VATIGFLMLAAGRGANGSEADVRIAVLVSQDAVPYQEALAGFQSYLAEQGVGAVYDVHALRGDPQRVAPALQEAAERQARVVLTLGSLATQAAIRQRPELPIVAGMVLKAGELGGSANATCVFLEFSPETEIRWLSRLLPKERRIAALFNSDESEARVVEASRAAKEIGLRLEGRKLVSPRDLPAALESLASQADVLWGIPDPVVFNPQTAQSILLFSLRHRIPLVGLSLSWVSAGALYALDRDYQDIGRQCGELALQVIHGARAGALPPSAPRKVVYSVNLKTARQLKVEIPRSLVEGAQKVIE